MSAADGETVAPMGTLSANEHWLVMQGGLEVELEGRVEPTRLAEQDGPTQSKQSLHHAFACRIHFEPFTVCLQWRCCGKQIEPGRRGRACVGKNCPRNTKKFLIDVANSADPADMR